MRALNNKNIHVTCLNKNKDGTLLYEDIRLKFISCFVDKLYYVT